MENSMKLDEWNGDRGATLLGFSSTSLADGGGVEHASRQTIGFNPVMTQRFMRTSPTAPTILDRLEFCYCTQRDLQTRRKNLQSMEARHKRALTTNPKSFHFRKDAMKTWELGIPDVRKRLKKNKPAAVVHLSRKGLQREVNETTSQIENFEGTLKAKIAAAEDGNSPEKETKTDSLISDSLMPELPEGSNQPQNEGNFVKKNKRRRKKKDKERMHFNEDHTTNQLTPRSLRRVHTFFQA